MSLLQYLASRDPNGVLFYAKEKISVGAVLQRCNAILEGVEKNSTQRVTSSYPVDFYCSLLAFDGHVKRIVVGDGNENEGGGSSSEKLNGTEWILFTSGTTGTPKAIRHNLNSLFPSRTSKPTPNARWGLLYDYKKFAGLQVFFEVLKAQASLIIPVGENLSENIQHLVASGCTHLSGTPSLWRQLMMVPDSEKLPLEQITMGGEIVDQRILDLVSLKWPKAQITHIYASTEFGVGFSVKDRKAGVPMDILESSSSGKSFVISGGTLQVKTADGLFDTGDVVTVREDRVYFQGRATGTINVGGRKVLPEEVEQVILSTSGVHGCRVFAKSSSILGSLVIAEVVAREGIAADKLRQEILANCKASLDDFKVPAQIKFVNEIETQDSGKMRRGHPL